MLALCVGCSGPQTNSGFTGKLEASLVADTSVGLPPESLLEPPPVTPAERLALQARRSQEFCVAMTSIRDLPEPAPDDVDGLLAFAARYHGALAGVDFAATLPQAEDGPKKRLAKPMIETIEREQAQLYAYRARLAAAASIAEDRRRRGLDARGPVQELVTNAFVQLVNSTFTQDDQKLRAAMPELCPEAPVV